MSYYRLCTTSQALAILTVVPAWTSVLITSVTMAGVRNGLNTFHRGIENVL
ncbi:hypothetical protein M405DRAFT_807299 [Rhizopogon salebrosus TDB-379]|nr:hypothetical protein M405DRAFT_807299 [Rhizopogon salebrosus TDB-379]